MEEMITKMGHGDCGPIAEAIVFDGRRHERKHLAEARDVKSVTPAIFVVRDAFGGDRVLNQKAFRRGSPQESGARRARN